MNKENPLLTETVWKANQSHKKKKNQENGCGILTPEPETTEEQKAHQWEQLEGNNHTT